MTDGAFDAFKRRDIFKGKMEDYNSKFGDTRKLPYILAISFSNVQHYYYLPMIFVGLAFDSDDGKNLISIRTKEDLFSDLNKLPKFDLSLLENELAKFKKYVVSYRVVNSEKPKSKNRMTLLTSERFLDGYLETIYAILSSNLLLSFKEMKSCYVHAPINRDGELITLQKSLKSSHPVFKFPLVFQSKNNFNEFMHLARLFASYEYLKQRRIRRRFIYDYVRNANTDLLHVTRLHWKSPYVQYYAGSFVGYPDLIVRTRTENKKIPLIPGEEIHIFPIARFCQGITDEFRNEFCMQTDNKRPFGTIITNKKFERCASCSKKSLHIRCISQHPKCDGSQVLCGNNDFAGNVCNGNFAVYLTIFNDILKVGRSILSRTIGRLLEQSALDALIFYPINSIDAAHMIERKITIYLRRKVKHLKTYGITRVVRIVRTEDRFEHVRLFSKKNGSNEREHAYDEMRRLLERANHPEIRSLFALESRRIDLSQNWFVDETLEIDQTDLIKETQFIRIDGKIKGIVGSFVFVNKKAYALNNLQGFVMECQ